MSMGSTRAWWLAAVDDRVAAVVAVACLTRYQNLIAHGGLRQHGVYYFVNGLLSHFDSEGVLALIAPRPFLALTGDLDAGSPADGVRALERAVGGTYEALGQGNASVAFSTPTSVTPTPQRCAPRCSPGSVAGCGRHLRAQQLGADRSRTESRTDALAFRCWRLINPDGASPGKLAVGLQNPDVIPAQPGGAFSSSTHSNSTRSFFGSVV